MTRLSPLKVSPVATTTPYAANDLLGAVLTSQQFGVEATQDLYVDSIRAVLDHTVGLDFDILIYSTTVATVPADNAPFAFTASQLYTKVISYIQLVTADFVKIQGTNVFHCAKAVPAFFVQGGKPYSIAVCAKTGFTPLVTDPLRLQFNAVQLGGLI